MVSNGVPSLQMKSVGSHRKSGREKEGKEEEGFMIRVLPTITSCDAELIHYKTYVIFVRGFNWFGYSFPFISLFKCSKFAWFIAVLFIPNNL